MNTTTAVSLQPSLVSIARRTLRAVASTLSRAQTTWAGLRRARATAHAAGQLDNHMLRDIGLDPGGFRRADPLFGWPRIALACTLAVAAPAWGASSASTTLGPIHLELVDLRPEDGITPSVGFSVDGDEAGVAAVAGETWPPEVYQHARYGSWLGNALTAQTRHASAAATVGGGAAASPAGTRALLTGKAVDFVGPEDISALYGAVVVLNQGTNPAIELAPWTALVFSFDVSTDLATRHANDYAFTSVGLAIDDGMGNELRDEYTLECVGPCRKIESRTFSLTFRNDSDTLRSATWSVWGNVTGTGFASAVPEPSTMAMLLAGFGVIGRRMRRSAAGAQG